MTEAITTLPAEQARIVPVVLAQHAEDAAVLHATRTRLASSPHVKLYHLQRFDDRVDAHLDGLRIAGEHAWRYCAAALERPSAGAAFAAAIQAIEASGQQRDAHIQLDRLIALSEAVTTARRGLLSAMGWLDSQFLRGIVADLLRSRDGFRRLLGVAACGIHRVDPGLTAARRFEDENAFVRARAWRTAGELGRHELVSTSAAAAATDEDPACQFWAAWSAVLLGDKHSGLERLMGTAAAPGSFQSRAFQLSIQASNLGASDALLQPLAQDRANIRWVIRGAGLAGDPIYIPWLIRFMADDKLARLAGESFSLIAGLDLAWLDLERKPPENFEPGPNDDPNDPNVDMDEDDGLPWPDQKLIEAWWSANSHRFQPGVRYFMGEPLNRENCLRVLKEGFQRQRIAAAFYLSLLNPGTPLFEWRAPAWRQQRLLATMT